MENNKLLNSFGSGASVPTESVGILVTGYILPNSGPETVKNTRIVGHRWDNGQSVEVALRPVEALERPSIGQFHNDVGSANPVTTPVDGTIIVEGAYVDKKLAPLNSATQAVINARWITRISESRAQGWGLSALARVNPPRLMDASNPQKGHYRTISIMCDDQATQITHIDQLDEAVLNFLDVKARDASKFHHKRPGAVSAFIRLSAGDQSKLIELSGGFHKPAGAERSVPKTVDMVAEDLKNNSFWQKNRKVLTTALQHPQYTIEVIPGSSLYIGKKTLQASMAKGRSRVTGADFSDGEKTIPLFTQMSVGIRRTPLGDPQVIFVRPTTWRNICSSTGRPSQEEIERSRSESLLKGEQKANKDTAPSKPIPAQSATTNNPAPAQPVQHKVGTGEKLQVSTSTSVANSLVVRAQNHQQAEFLKQNAARLSGRYTEANQTLTFNETYLPTLFNGAQQHGFEIHVNNHRPELHTPAPQAATSEPAPAEQSIDLSSLDLNGLDLDNALGQAYEQQYGQSR